MSSVWSKSDENNGDKAPKPSSTVVAVTTKVPGIDNTKVIPSRPDFVRENSSKPENPARELDGD